MVSNILRSVASTKLLSDVSNVASLQLCDYLFQLTTIYWIDLTCQIHFQLLVNPEDFRLSRMQEP